MKSNYSGRNLSGFTTVEFFIIAVIILCLAAMSISTVQKIQERKSINKNVENNSIFDVIGSEYINHNSYTIVKHKDTGVVYVMNRYYFFPLVDKDGKPLVKY